MSLAEKDNNIYGSSSQLNPISRVERLLIVKATPLSFPASTRSRDLFSGIIPKTIHDAVALVYESQREALVRAEVGKLREANFMLNGYEAKAELFLLQTLYSTKVLKRVLCI